jgi:hypothetical protein
MLERRSRELDGWEASLGLPRLPPECSSEASRLLSLPPEAIRKLSGPECSEAAVLLMSYAVFLQRAAGREQSRARWAEESIRRITAVNAASQKGFSYQERLALAVRESPAASELDRARVMALSRLDRIVYVSTKVEGLARAFMSMASGRRNESD